MKDRDTRGFYIRFQNVTHTRSSVVGIIVLFEQRVSNYCVAETIHGETTEDKEWSHIIAGNSEVCQIVRRDVSIEFRPRNGRPSYEKDRLLR